MQFLGDALMAEFTPKIEMGTQDDSDAKKIYAHPDVIDLLPVDETQGGKLFNPIEGAQGLDLGS